MVAVVYGDDQRMFALVPVSVQTGAYSAAANQFVPCDSSGGAFAVALPAAPADQTLIGVEVVNGSGTVTVNCSGSDTIRTVGGSTSTTLTAAGQGVVLQYFALLAVWYPIMTSGSSGGGGAVSSVFGRSGAVAAVSGDYSFSLVSGTASIAQGGTGQGSAVAAFNALSPLTTLGDTLSNDGTNDIRVAGNTTATRKFLRQTGTGSVSAAPAWDTLLAADVPTLNQSTTGSAASFTGALAGDVTGTQGATVVGKIQGVAITTAEANLVSDLNNAASRSATATLLPGEETIYTGSTSGQTLTLPASPPSSSVNTVTNTATVSVTLAPGAGATISNFGTAGNITVPAGYVFGLVYIGTVWYVQNAGPSDFAKSSVLSIANGGTGSATQPFVDLTTAQSVGGVKTFTARPVLPAPPSYSAFTPVTSTSTATTITGTTALTALASGLVVPASALAAGQAYTFKAWGALTTTLAAQTFTLALYWGGIAGTQLITFGAAQPNSGGTETGASWMVEYEIVANSATSIAVMGIDGLAYFFNSQTNATTTVANSSSEQFVIGVTPSASACSITCSGFYCARVA